MAQVENFRQLKDYEVLGIGALRRAEVESAPEKIKLLLHPDLVPSSRREIYQQLLTDTCQWLQPSAITEEKIFAPAEDFVYHLLLAEFKKIFPRTVVRLGEGVEILLRNYLAEFPWQGPLLTDHLRYVPLFLRQQFQDPGLNSLALKEWLWSYLQFADFGRVATEAGRVTVNPSLQTLHTEIEVAEVDLSPGLYIYYYEETGRRVHEYRLDLVDAAVVETLQEDRKYTLDQLVEHLLLMDLATKPSQATLRKRVLFLISQGILSLSDAKII